MVTHREKGEQFGNNDSFNKKKPFLFYLLYVATQSLYLMIVLNELGVVNKFIPPYIAAYLIVLGSSFTGALLWSILGALIYLFLFYRGMYNGPLFPILSVASYYFLFSSISLTMDLILLMVLGTSRIELYSSIKAMIDTLLSTLSFIYFYHIFNRRYGMSRVNGIAMIFLLLIDVVLRLYYPKIAAAQLLKNQAPHP